MILLFGLAIVLLVWVWTWVWGSYRQWKVAGTVGYNPFYLLWKRQDFSVVGTEIVKKWQQYEGFYHLWFGKLFVMLATDADSAQFLLKNEFVPKFQVFGEDSLFGKNLLVMNGDDWRRHRSIINFAFNTNSYKSYFPTFNSSTTKLLTKLAPFADSQADIDMTKWLSKFTIDLLGLSVFHYDFCNLDDKIDEYYSAYKELLNAGRIHLLPFLNKLPLPSVLRRRRATQKLCELFDKMVALRKAGESFGDIMDHLIQGQADQALSHQEFLSNMFIFFVAGHETTSTALSYAFAELAERQDVQERLYREVVEFYGEGEVTFESVHQKPAPYLDWFIMENLRMHPPAPLLTTRYATRDLPYKTHVLPKGALVGIDIYNVHRNPRHWDHPDLFDPERFSPERKAGRHKFAFLPFSLGPRQCIGNTFSEIEQRLLLVRFLQRFRVLPPKNSPPLDLKKPTLDRVNIVANITIANR